MAHSPSPWPSWSAPHAKDSSLWLLWQTMSSGGFLLQGTFETTDGPFTARSDPRVSRKWRRGSVAAEYEWKEKELILALPEALSEHHRDSRTSLEAWLARFDAPCR